MHAPRVSVRAPNCRVHTSPRTRVSICRGSESDRGFGVARPERKDLLGLAAALTIGVLALVALLAGIIYLVTLPLIDWIT